MPREKTLRWFGNAEVSPMGLEALSARVELSTVRIYKLGWREDVAMNPPPCDAKPVRYARTPRGQAAIFSQLSAHFLHASTQLFMSPTRSHSSAHCRQISAHSRHVCLWCSVPISIK